ncbi:MAG: ribokinase [Chloroflexi bacterium]|nr:MAG: ribokinase [Chloroflexota bacterium]
MYRIGPLEPIDYLVIGHLTRDLTPNGPRLGGTATFSALTARALGLRVGVLTACEDCLASPELEQEGIRVVGVRSDATTTFENIHTPTGRIQYIHSVASTIDLSMVPDDWRSTPVVHLGPVAREIDPTLARAFSNSFVGLTPQGWMRTWDADGRVTFAEWPEAAFVMQSAGAAVISVHDVHGNEDIIEDMASSIRVLAVTDGPNGARLYWNGDLRNFRPPEVAETDPTGAGDIFAAAFFIRLQATRDPWEAARFATYLASYSVMRVGLDGIPTAEEIQAAMTEVI